jgi:hypothetical protein
MSDNLVMNAKNLKFSGVEEKNWLKTLLQEQKITVEFVKKDGSVRKMVCTLSESKIPAEKVPKNVGKKQNDEILAVFDIENNGWRSFRWDSIQRIQFSLPEE